MRGKLRNRVLSEFEPQIASQLVKFADHISMIDADYLMFVARKSLRLYDMFSLIGLPQTQVPIISDRVLEVGSDQLKDKKIALIDDTLIVGTSLAKLQKKIRSSVTDKISTHVFCVNKDWWVPNLLTPDVALLHLDDRQTMTFCAAEVKVFSGLAIPYQVDFPFSKPIEAPLAVFNKLLRSMEWHACDLSTPRQDGWGACVHTFLPDTTIFDELEAALGRELSQIIDIFKVRTFARVADDRKSLSAATITVVPIVTIKPLSSPSIDLVFNAIVQCFKNIDANCDFENSFIDSIGRARFIQYVLSVALGERFFSSFFSHDEVKGGIAQFDVNEAKRHIGPWLEDKINLLHRHAHEVIFGEFRYLRDLKGVAPAQTPIAIMEVTDDVIDSSATSLASLKKERSASPGPTNILTDFSEIFVDFFDKHEIPAREEAKKYGARLIEEDFTEAKNRNRLEVGIPWSKIVEYLSGIYDLKPREQISNVMSLLLDIWHDLGIAVPIFCQSQGVVFRAYRHGEDVKITNQELALVRELAVGYLEATERETIPRLTMEKLLVSWTRVGLARDWLSATWGPTGTDGLARIGYYLKGAIVFRPSRTDSIIAGDKGTWLSEYCLRRGVLSASETGQFIPGKEIGANFERPWTLHEAKKFGRLFGLADRSGGPLENNAKKQTLLATCVSVRDLSCAIEAELQVIHDWLRDGLLPLTNSINWDDSEAIVRALAELRRSAAFEALFSARMKYLGYLNKEPLAIVNECCEFLRRDNAFAADEWLAMWSPLFDKDTPHDELTILRPVSQAMATIFGFGLGMFLLELTMIVASQMAKGRPKRATAGFLSRLRGFLEELQDRTEYDDYVKRLLARLSSIERIGDLQDFIPERVFEFVRDKFQEIAIDVITDKEYLNSLNSMVRREESIRKYDYLVWYDIIGSTGERFGLRGDELEKHEADVASFKRGLMLALDRLTETAEEQGDEVFAWNGTVESRNDEKHLFIRRSKDRAAKWVKAVVRTIYRETQRHTRVRVRMLIIPCSFAGSEVWRFERSTEVVGERFWLHLARLRESLKSTERSDFDLSRNTLYLAGDAIEYLNDVGEIGDLRGQVEYELVTSPDFLTLRTKVIGWNVGSGLGATPST